MEHAGTPLLAHPTESQVQPTAVRIDEALAKKTPNPRPAEVIFDVRDVTVTYGDRPAIRNVTMPIHRNEITALIGPSGCGKSTFIRCFNRMNDLIPGAKVHGTVTYQGQDLYAKGVDPVEVRRRIGMVF